MSDKHEMTAREYKRILQRMEKTQPMPEELYLHDKALCYCEIDKAISIVEQWAAEHPEKKRKTYAEDYFEKFPKAEPRFYDGRGKHCMIPKSCRQHCYGVVGQKCNGIGCSCSVCWNEEMEGEDE